MREAQDFAEMLKLLRTRLYMTQERFARMIGTSVSNVKSWEIGKQLPTYENLEMLVGAILDHTAEGDYRITDEDVLKLEDLYEGERLQKYDKGK